MVFFLFCFCVVFLCVALFVGLFVCLFVLVYFFLIVDIKKHTAEDNPDKITLERAIESLKEVMT